MTGNGKKGKAADVIRRHKTIIVAVGVPLAFILLIALPILVINLKWNVIDPTYWPHQEKTVYSFNNTDDDPNGGGVIVAVCSDSQDVVLTVHDGRGRRVESIREGKLQVIVPPETSYTFVAKNTTDRWIHANVHECDIDT